MNSCKQQEETTYGEYEEKLFTESASLIQEFIGEFREAVDSLEIDSLNEAFDKRIVEINFSVPPETDLKLTEQDNDSLFNLLKIMRKERDSRLKELAKPYPDTIPVYESPDPNEV